MRNTVTPATRQVALPRNPPALLNEAIRAARTASVGRKDYAREPLINHTLRTVAAVTGTEAKVVAALSGALRANAPATTLLRFAPERLVIAAALVPTEAPSGGIVGAREGALRANPLALTVTLASLSQLVLQPRLALLPGPARGSLLADVAALTRRLTR